MRPPLPARELPSDKCSSARESEEKFKWSEVRRGLFNVQVWLSSTAYFAILSGLYSFGLFVSFDDKTP